MTDMIDRIVKLYRSMSREARHLTVVIISAAVMIAAVSMAAVPASAMSSNGDEEIPGITAPGEETAPEDGDFEYAPEENAEGVQQNRSKKLFRKN